MQVRGIRGGAFSIRPLVPSYKIETPNFLNFEDSLLNKSLFTRSSNIAYHPNGPEFEPDPYGTHQIGFISFFLYTLEIPPEVRCRQSKNYLTICPLNTPDL